LYGLIYGLDAFSPVSNVASNSSRATANRRIACPARRTLSQSWCARDGGPAVGRANSIPQTTETARPNNLSNGAIAGRGGSKHLRHNSALELNQMKRLDSGANRCDPAAHVNAPFHLDDLFSAKARSNIGHYLMGLSKHETAHAGAADENANEEAEPRREAGGLLPRAESLTASGRHAAGRKRTALQSSSGLLISAVMFPCTSTEVLECMGSETAPLSSRRRSGGIENAEWPDF